MFADNEILNHFPKQNHGLSFGCDILLIVELLIESMLWKFFWKPRLFLIMGNKPAASTSGGSFQVYWFDQWSGPAVGGGSVAKLVNIESRIMNWKGGSVRMHGSKLVAIILAHVLLTKLFLPGNASSIHNT